MKERSTLKSVLNFLGLALIAISIPISIIILKSGQLDFSINAFLNEDPVNVVVSSVKSDSFTVSWYTEKALTGMLKLTETMEPISELADTKYHLITVKNLDPSTTYEFQLYSNGNIYPDVFKAITYAEKISDVNKWVNGQVFSTDGRTVQSSGLVYLRLMNGNESQELVSTLNEMGGYKFNFNDLKDKNGNAFDYKQLVDVEVTVFVDPKSDAIKKKFSLDFNYQNQIPNIYLAEPNLDIIPGVEGD